MQPLTEVAAATLTSSQSTMNLARAAISSTLTPSSYFGTSKVVESISKSGYFAKTALTSLAELIYSVTATIFWATASLLTLGNKSCLSRMNVHLGTTIASFSTIGVSLIGVVSPKYGSSLSLYILALPLTIIFRDQDGRLELVDRYARTLVGSYNAFSGQNISEDGAARAVIKGLQNFAANPSQDRSQILQNALSILRNLPQAADTQNT